MFQRLCERLEQFPVRIAHQNAVFRMPLVVPTNREHGHFCSEGCRKRGDFQLVARIVLISCPQSVAKCREKHLHAVFGRERSHQADAKDLAREFAESTGNIDPVVFQQTFAHLGVIDPFWNARRIDVRDTMALGNVHP